MQNDKPMKQVKEVKHIWITKKGGRLKICTIEVRKAVEIREIKCENYITKNARLKLTEKIMKDAIESLNFAKN